MTVFLPIPTDVTISKRNLPDALRIQQVERQMEIVRRNFETLGRRLLSSSNIAQDSLKLENFGTDARQILFGKVLTVDSVNGNDTTGKRGDLRQPFLTIAKAIFAAVSGDVIWVLPGTYNLAAGITIPSGVTIRGMSVNAATLQMLGVVGATTLITMGESSRLEDMTLKLTSSSHVTLTGIKFGGTTSATAKVRTLVLDVDNSGAGAGTSAVTGILVQSTGVPVRETSAIRASTITVNSTGSGKKRALLLDTSIGNFFTRDVNFAAHGGTDAIAVEVNLAGSLVGINTAVCDGDTADVSRTAGGLEIGGVDLVHSNANAFGFTATQISFALIWADPGGLPSGTRFYRPGSAAVTATEIKLNVPRKGVIKKLHVRILTAPGAGKTDTWTVRKNGVDTALTVSLTGTGTLASIDTVSVSFAADNDISLKVVGAAGSGTTDSVCLVEFY